MLSNALKSPHDASTAVRMLSYLKAQMSWPMREKKDFSLQYRRTAKGSGKPAKSAGLARAFVVHTHAHACARARARTYSRTHTY